MFAANSSGGRGRLLLLDKKPMRQNGQRHQLISRNVTRWLMDGAGKLDKMEPFSSGCHCFAKLLK